MLRPLPTYAGGKQNTSQSSLDVRWHALDLNGVLQQTVRGEVGSWSSYRARESFAKSRLSTAGSELLCLPTLSDIDKHWYQLETAQKVLGAPWVTHLERKLHRDEQRLRDYRATIATQIEQRTTRKRASSTTRTPEDSANRIHATQRELDRKLQDTRERYRVTVSSHLRALLLIGLPTVHVICELQRKTIKRRVTAVYNPFSRHIEPLLCSRSLRPTYSFSLSNDEAAIIGAHADARPA